MVSVIECTRYYLNKKDNVIQKPIQTYLEKSNDFLTLSGVSFFSDLESAVFVINALSCSL